MNLRDYIEKAGYKLVDSTYYSLIDNWLSWYKGKVDSFHRYRVYNGQKWQNCTRATLNMAKKGPEAWADLLWNHECQITVSSDQELVDAVLDTNTFTDEFNELTEQAWALGTGAVVVYPEHGETVLDYLTAPYVFPIEWRGSKIISCAFAGEHVEDKKKIVYLMIHVRQSDGSYRVYNKFFERVGDTDEIREIDTPEGILDEYTTKVKRFAIIRPGIANNINPKSPMGISVYANHLDNLKSIDLAYDGAKVAMQLGRPRMGVSGAMQKPGPDGLESVFDPNDMGVYDLGTAPGEDSSIRVDDLTTQYRAADFEGSLQTQLNVYSQNLSLGDKAFRLDPVSFTTATQVISSDTKMLRAMEKHHARIRPAVIDIVRAVLDASGHNPDVEVEVNFDDSATRDKEAERLRFWQQVTLGKFPYWRYLHKYEGYDEKEAKAIATEGGRMNREEL